MIRTCPKCGDYYADELLAFCPADGTPLVELAPHGERWREASRIVEAKEKRLREERRRLKWRRVLLRAMTILVVTMVVIVVAVNGLIYLSPQPEEVAEDKPSEDKPTLGPAPAGSLIPSTRGKPARATSPRPVPSPTPRVVQIKPTPTPDTRQEPTPTPTPSPTPTPLPTCSDADRSRELRTIINRYGDKWRRSIEGERQKIIAESVRGGDERAEASLGPLEYESSFLQGCAAALVTARYAWQVSSNLNETVKVVSVPKKKRFTCVKTLGIWLCS
ncbi:MAG TPA: hypothetical protein VF544_20860 [Pyrinomonadaceae bacterium]|jgi:hypothetical protein